MLEVKRLLTKHEAAAYLRISTKTLDRYIKQNLVIPIRVGKQFRFPENVLSTLSNCKEEIKSKS